MGILIRPVRSREVLKNVGKGRNTVILRRMYPVPGTGMMEFAKRSVDMVFSALAIMFVLPVVIPVVYILLRFSSRGPLFFVQDRIGKNGHVFRCYKFRTMHVNDDADLRQCSENDERIFRVGKFLRATHMDELPQLLNVLKGDMSLVGPRPHMVYHDELFSAMVPEYILRQQVRPGLTGLAQVQGCHGPTPDLESIRRRTRYDLHYVRNASPKLDTLIFFRTIRQVLTRTK
jgi:putative colanic acid biosynthesis UDP-glucose lipid carrier transferase